MASASLLRPSSHNPTIYITGLQSNVTIKDLADKFGTIGRIKTDKRSGEPKIYVYNDKTTNAPKGDGTVTFEDPNAASAAVDWFNGTEFMGSQITVQLAEEKEYVPHQRSGGRPRHDHGSYGESRSYNNYERHTAESDDYSGNDSLGHDGKQSRGNASGYRGGSKSSVSGEWNCPSCSNMNFAKRMECFKCHTPRPSSSEDQQAFKPQAMPNFANPGDWSCKACSNINWARRNTCNRCNASKPTAVVEKRTGRGGGYNEREEPYEKHDSSSRSNRDSYRGQERSYRQDSSYENPSRREPYSDSDYGYGSRDRSAAYAPSNDSYNSRGSGYRQDAGYRRERSRSPYRY